MIDMKAGVFLAATLEAEFRRMNRLRETLLELHVFFMEGLDSLHSGRVGEEDVKADAILFQRASGRKS